MSTSAALLTRPTAAALAATYADRAEPVPVEQVSPTPPRATRGARAYLVLRWVVTVLAGWLLYRQVSQVDLGRVLGAANWGWVLAATACFGVALAGAALNLVGASPVRLGLLRTYSVQVAGGFVRLVSPSAVGAAALNARYVQRAGVSAPLAIASVGAAQVIQLGSTIALLALLGPGTGLDAVTGMVDGATSTVVAAAATTCLAALVLTAALWRPARVRITRPLRAALDSIRLTRSSAGSAARRLSVAVGGSVLLTLGLVLALTASVAAMGGPLNPVAIGTAFLIGSAIGSVVPTPGGVGTVEAALVTALVASGLAVAVALPAVLVFRAITVWLPVPLGWFAFQALRRRGHL